jgi:hypothetical protein
MTLDEKGLPARLYKTSADADLALLKLDRMPAGVKELPTITLAAAGGRAGSTCVAIGHPTDGLPWTLRSGEVGQVGSYPHDLIDVVIARLALTGAERDQAEALLKAAPSRRILLSTFPLNFGDSGGPLVNDRGELIGVSFAITSGESSGVPGRFSYHVDLEEVRTFLKHRPAQPLVAVPDPWPPGVLGSIVDLDGDSKPDMLVFGLKEGAAPTGFLLDLQGTNPSLAPGDLANPVKRKAWKPGFALQRLPKLRTFYDTDADGPIDLVLTDDNGDLKADAVLRLGKNGWAGEEARGRALIDAAYIQDVKTRARLEKLLKELGK